MAIDYSVLAISKGTPAKLQKGWKKTAKQAALDAAYEIVNARDKNHSRVTGIELFPNGNDRVRREHNHIQKRSIAPGLREDPKNIHLCSAYEHYFITTGALLIEGTDASKRLIFHWNRRVVEPGKEPFKLLSKRRSQNR